MAQCENRTLLTQSEIALQLGVSERTLKEMLSIERKLTPEIKEFLDISNSIKLKGYSLNR